MASLTEASAPASGGGKKLMIVIGLLGLVDERCGGVFDHIDDVLPREEREGFMARYKAAAGFAIETLNAAPPTIAPGQRVAVG